MKKLLLFIVVCIVVIGCSKSGQNKFGAYYDSGVGWQQVLKKENFKDSVNFVRLPKVVGTNVLIVSDTVSMDITAILTVGDTIVTAKNGRIVYKTSDYHFYGCVNATNTSTPKWKRLDN